MRKKLNKVLIFISVLVLIIGLYFIKSGLSKEDNETKIIYSSKITRDVKYNVSLTVNNFYDPMPIQKGLSYPVKGIGIIPIEFVYDYKGNEKVDLNYTYNITIDLIGNVSGSSSKASSLIWSKNYVVTPQQPVKNVEDKNFSIKDSVNVNYRYFNTLRNNYENHYGIKLNSYLSIKMNVTYSYLLPNSSTMKEKKDYIEVRIPLEDNITYIEDKFEKSSVNDEIDINVSKNGDNSIKVYGGIILSLLSIVMLALCIKKQELTSEKKYYRNLNKVLREYSDLIVTIVNKPELAGLKQLRLSNVDDLVDVAEQNRVNIICYELIKNKCSLLFVVSNGYVYIYEITADSL